MVAEKLAALQSKVKRLGDEHQGVRAKLAQLQQEKEEVDERMSQYTQLEQDNAALLL